MLIAAFSSGVNALLASRAVASLYAASTELYGAFGVNTVDPVAVVLVVPDSGTCDRSVLWSTVVVTVWSPAVDSARLPSDTEYELNVNEPKLMIVLS